MATERVESPGGSETRRIYRSKTDRHIAGVCGGFAEYFQVDPTLIRVIWFASIFIGGVGIVSYIAAWIILPEAEGPAESAQTVDPEKSRKFGIAVGIFLIFIGLLFLSDSLHYHFFMVPWRFRNFDGGVIVALIVIALGAYLLVNRPAQADSTETASLSAGPKKLTRSVKDRKIAGVCGGLAKYFAIDSNLARIGMVILGVVQPLLVLIAYVLFMVVVPEDTSEDLVGDKNLVSNSEASNP